MFLSSFVRSFTKVACCSGQIQNFSFQKFSRSNVSIDRWFFSTWKSEMNAYEKMFVKQIYPPIDRVRSLKKLDYDLFRKNVALPYVISTTENLSHVIKSIKPFMIRMPCFQPVQKIKENHQLYLNPDLMDDQVQSIIKDLKNKDLLVLNSDGQAIDFFQYELTYENFNYHDIFRAILPEDIESISGFSTIGHIIHLNLRDDTLPYKYLIGQVLLDKIRTCRLVVNKLDIINTKFRNFQMEVLAQDKNDPPVSTVVTTTESSIKYQLDFAKVYWNPRLAAERDRICSKLHKKIDYMYDVFAGIGPFALTAAKNAKCKVLANDLNPDSYHWLKENIKINKFDKIVSAFNLDGRDFIRNELKNDLLKSIENFDGSNLNRKFHVVMNLPELAMTFLNEFDGLLSSSSSLTNHESYRIPSLDVHCYCFVKNIDEEEAKNFVIDLASKNLGHQLCLKRDVEEILNVRKVAPQKNMYRISFKVSQDILYGIRKRDFNVVENENDYKTNKRIKI